ncbi:reverse transcriptase domain-containing protein [Tanacetum coccineum]
MEDFYRPSLIGRGGPIAPTIAPGTDFVLKNHMVRLLRQNCQFHGFKDEDANEHLDKYLSITQFIKQKGISQDIINLNVFLFSLSHEAESWFYTLKTHSIHTWEEMVSKFLSKYFPYSRTLQLRKEILNFWQLPTESVFEAWERFKSCLRKCPDHRILLLNQILTFYNGITMIDQERLMVAAGGNFMRKTPQEAYDLIENMTQHHFQWDAEVYYNTTTDMSAYYSETTFASRERVEVLGKQTGYTIQSVQHNPGPGHPNTFYYSDSDESDDDEPSEMIEDQKSIHHLSGSPTPSSDPVVASLSPSLTPTGDSDSILEETDTLLPHHDSTSPEVNDDIFDPEGDIRLLERLLNLDSTKDLPPPHELNNEIFDPEGDILILENLLKDDPSEAKNSEIDSLIKGPSDTFLMGDEDIKLNPPMDVDNLVPIPRVSEKPLDSLDSILETSKMTITDPLFDFDSEFTLNLDNPILNIQNKESDESGTETIMDEVQINSTQSTAQIPSPYEKLNFDLTMPKPILTFSRFRYGIFGSHRVFDILGPRLPFSLSYNFGLVFSKEYLKFLSLNIFLLGDENADFDPERDILQLEKLLNDDPSSPLPPKELYFEDLKVIQSSIDTSLDFEDDYYDTEGDFIYLESLLIKDTTHNLPPDVFSDIDSKSLNDKHDFDNLKSMVKVFDAGIHEKIVSPTYVKLPFEDCHYLSLTYVIRIFLPYLTYSMNSSLPLSSGSVDIFLTPESPLSFFFSRTRWFSSEWNSPCASMFI